jgi:hypothetical protein
VRFFRPRARNPSAAVDAGPVKSPVDGKPHRPFLFKREFGDTGSPSLSLLLFFLQLGHQVFKVGV